MKDLDPFDRRLEEAFGLISQGYVYFLWETSKLHGSQWEIEDQSTMDIIVVKENAALVYSLCKHIRSGYSVGLKRGGMTLVKEAREKAHRFLYEEANDPSTPIERKIALVRLTSK